MVYDLENKEFKIALELASKTNKSFFLTGKAGTGKSTFLKYITENVSKNFVVVAPTGIAAVNVGGTSIHSFFQFPLRPLLPEDHSIKVFQKFSEKGEIFRSMDTLIIDEVSMVRADLIDAIDYSMRRNTGKTKIPFGGKQVIFVGDIFQLKPIENFRNNDLEIMKEFYTSNYFYNAKVFEQVELLTIELKKVYRQTDINFIDLLDKVRTNNLTHDDFKALNSRVVKQDSLNNEEFIINLTSRNDLANRVNELKFNEINTAEYRFKANVTGDFEENKFPTVVDLSLKEGAQVIFIKNDAERRWVNGTIGHICELTDESIRVILENGEVTTVDKTSWKNIQYTYNQEHKKIEQKTLGSFEQYPLKLAWAITIHKSQGLTFDKVIIDFGGGAFASGQVYVALSRVRSFDGLYLKNSIRPRDIYLDKEIVEFSKNFHEIQEVEAKLKKELEYIEHQEKVEEFKLRSKQLMQSVNMFE